VVKILIDLFYSTCYFYFTGIFLWQEETNLCTASTLSIIAIQIIIPLPLWFRFAQVLRQYYDSGERWPCLLNALKYAIACIVSILAATHTHYNKQSNPEWDLGRRFWLCVQIFSTLYSFSWDCKMDWGLFDSDAPPSHHFLRRKLLFLPTTYYAAMLINLCLRFSWILSLAPFFHEAHHETRLVPLLAVLELFRRFLWGIFRAEQEHTSKLTGFFKSPSGDSLPSAAKKQENGRNDRLLFEIILMISLGFFVAYICVFKI